MQSLIARLIVAPFTRSSPASIGRHFAGNLNKLAWPSETKVIQRNYTDFAVIRAPESPSIDVHFVPSSEAPLEVR